MGQGSGRGNRLLYQAQHCVDLPVELPMLESGSQAPALACLPWLTCVFLSQVVVLTNDSFLCTYPNPGLLGSLLS